MLSSCLGTNLNLSLNLTLNDSQHTELFKASSQEHLSRIQEKSKSERFEIESKPSPNELLIKSRSRPKKLISVHPIFFILLFITRVNSEVWNVAGTENRKLPTCCIIYWSPDYSYGRNEYCWCVSQKTHDTEKKNICRHFQMSAVVAVCFKVHRSHFLTL